VVPHIRRSLAAGSLALVAVAGWAGPAAAEPQVRVGPVEAVRPGDSVNVTFSGFAPSYTLMVRQCIPEPRSGDDCDFLSLVTIVSDRSGAGALSFPVRALPAPELPGPVACDPEHACWVVVSEDLNDLTQPWAGAPVSLAGTPASAADAVSPSRGASTNGWRWAWVAAGAAVPFAAATLGQRRRRRGSVGATPSLRA